MEITAKRDRGLFDRTASLRSVAVAVGVAVVGSAALFYGWAAEEGRTGVLLGLVGVAAYTDLRRGTIPNALSGLGALLGLAFASVGGLSALGAALGAGVLAGLVLLAVRAFGYLVAGQPGMGYGDVKLAVVLGLLLGWGSLWALYLAAAVAGLAGVVGIASGRLRRRQRIPFAPFIAVGVLLHLFALPPERLLPWL